jgi:hypothetical protein
MRTFILSTIIIVFSFSTNAQYSQTIRGTVTDKTTLSTLPGASIAVQTGDKTIGTITDMNGVFELTMIPVGKHNLEVSFIGYEPQSIRNLEVRSGKETVLNIELIEKVVSVDEVVISAFRNGETRNKMAVLSARQFSIKETEKYAGSWGDPSRMAANFAGVITANDSRNDIIIRGNSPQGLLWRLEGVNIPNPNHFAALGSTGGPVSMLNNNLLANSDFFTGAFPAEYGNALSGVFDLKLRNGNNSKHEFTGQSGFSGIELGAEGPLSRKAGSSYMVNYRYSIPSLMDKLGFSASEGAVPNYQDLSFKLNMPTKHVGTWALFGIGGKSNIEFIDEEGIDGSSFDFINNTRTRNGSTTGILALTHRILTDEKSNLFSAVSATYSAGNTQIDTVKADMPDKRFYGEGNKESKLGITSRYTRKINSRNTFNIGGSFESYSINYADSVTGEVYNPPMHGTYIKDLDTNEKGLNLLQLYSEWQHRFNNSITLYGGLHFQEFMYNSTYAFDPRVSLSYRLPSNAKLSLAYGKHSQIQPLYTYFVEKFDRETGTYAQTNNHIGLTKAHHFVAGFDQMLTQNFKLKVETYYQSIYNIPVHPEIGHFSMVNAGNSFHQERVDNLVNGGTGQNYGVELTFERYLNNNYYFLITTSLFDSKYRGSDNVLRNTEFNTNRVLNALGGYEFRISENVSVDINMRTVWAGGKRNPYIDLEQSNTKGEVVYDHSKDYSFREKDYFKIDIRASLILNGKKITQEWALDLTNASNRKNIYSRAYNADKKEIVYVYQQGFYPMFLYRINF